MFTDLFMLELDGIEILMTLRKEAPRLKVIAISGGGSLSRPSEPLEAAEALGAYAAFDKPFDLDLFLQTVRDALAA